MQQLLSSYLLTVAPARCGTASQRHGPGEASDAIGAMDGMNQRNTMPVEQASAAAWELQEQASSVAVLLGRLKRDGTDGAASAAFAGDSRDRVRRGYFAAPGLQLTGPVGNTGVSTTLQTSDTIT